VQAGAAIIVTTVYVRLPPQGQVVQEGSLPVLAGHMRGGVPVAARHADCDMSYWVPLLAFSVAMEGHHWMHRPEFGNER